LQLFRQEGITHHELGPSLGLELHEADGLLNRLVEEDRADIAAGRSHPLEQPSEEGDAVRIPSVAIGRFWQAYRQLPRDVRKLATVAYRLWHQDAFHPSLHFKKVGSDLWSVRVGRS
jgi:hypothetical protein